MDPLLVLGDVPAYQNKMYASAEEARRSPRGDVVLVQDEETGLVSNAAYDPDLLSYDESYQNEQGLSTAFQEHMDAVLGKVLSRFGGTKIVEVGCGKGAFLDLLRAAGEDAVGVDPAYEGEAPYIIKKHFATDLGVRGDAIVMRHTLEHIADPVAFLDLIAEANGRSGVIYIEVPCLDHILETRSWFDVFYEHVNYFRLGDFNRMFGSVIESGRLFGEQYLYAFADLATLRVPNGAFERVEIPDDFFKGVDATLEKVSPDKKNVVWGAAAKGVMFSYHASIHDVRLDFAIDINPAKQGRFLAGSGLEVLAPESAIGLLSKGDNVFVMNSNYLNEISALAGEHPSYIAIDAI